MVYGDLLSIVLLVHVFVGADAVADLTFNCHRSYFFSVSWGHALIMLITEH